MKVDIKVYRAAKTLNQSYNTGFGLWFFEASFFAQIAGDGSGCDT
jgi:hypothetical protein